MVIIVELNSCTGMHLIECLTYLAIRGSVRHSYTQRDQLAMNLSSHSWGVWTISQQ